MALNNGTVLTNQQKAILQEFRSNVSDLLNDSHDDEYLLRWLIARKFDLQRSENMLREHVKLWKKLKLGKILKDHEFPEVITKYSPFCQTGFDKHGNVVLVYLHGNTDCKGVVCSLTLREHIKAFVLLVENLMLDMEKENKRTGRNAKRVVCVIDTAGLKMNQCLDKRVAKRTLDLINVFQANYPETLHACHIFNVPNFFYYWYNFAKSLFDPDLMKKFKIYGTSGWKEALLEEVGADALPAFFGGNLTDPDGNPECRTMFFTPQKVPESYYVINQQTPVVNDPDMAKVVVKERAYFNATVVVKLPNHVIRWRFQTLHHDIRFGLYYVPDGVKLMPAFSITNMISFFRIRRNSRDGHEVLIPLERIESHIFPEEGEFHCEKTGMYLLHFDNTFSWVTPKELYYKVEVVPVSKVFSSI